MNEELNNINNLTASNKSKITIFTTLTDEKTIFNLESDVDKKLNNCKGDEITIKDVYIKVIETPIDDSLEIKKICILLDIDGTSYVTASKMFTNQMIRYIENFGKTSFEKGVKIKIIERAVKGSSNKALGFELI